MSASSKKITLNAASAVVQVVFTAILYFFLYKYLLQHIGVKNLGVWSLIMSFSSIANLANFGITSGLVKFVAEYLGQNDESKIGKLILTSAITMAILFACMSMLVYWGAHYFLGYVVDEKYLSVATQILPYSLISLSINAVAGVFTSVLEGFQKNYLRNAIYMFSGILMFILVLLLTSTYQLVGVAMAQVIQAVFILLVSIVLCLSISKYNHMKFWKWSNSSFKELFNYGYRFQIVSVTQLLYEPTTKMLLSKFGGLALLGHYEMASRLVTQFRALLVNANQVVVPVIAGSHTTKTTDEKFIFFKRMNQLINLFASPMATVLILLSPIISLLWIGEINFDFIISTIILSISAVFNVACGPSYFSCLAEGKLSLLIVVHAFMAITNLLFGYLLYHLLGSYGIILGWGVALSAGSVLLIYYYAKLTLKPLMNVFSKNDIALFSLLVLVSIVIYFLFHTNQTADSVYLKIGILSIVSSIVLIPAVLKNEIFKFVLQQRISTKI